MSVPAENDQLTPRELEVAGLIGDALSDRQIAHKLHISVFTVRFYVDTILYKRGLHSRVAICKWWHRNYYYPSPK